MSAFRVTVCIPTYNGEDYLDQCLASVRGQTLAPFEILVVDDGSVDRTVAVAERHAAEDPRIAIVRNEKNLGLVPNWNRCVELARGDWIKFVFQDDHLEPACLETFARHAERGASFLSARRRIFYEAGVDEATRIRYEDIKQRNDALIEARVDWTPAQCADLALEHFGHNLFGEPTAVMLKRDLFARFGPFESALASACDLEYWARVSTNVGATHIPIDLATFRVHGASESARNQSERQFQMSVMDNLVILHAYLHRPAYAALRDHARSRRPRVELARIFERFRQQARTYADWMRRGSTPDPGPWRQWTAMVERFPGLGVSRIRNVLWRLRNRLARRSFAIEDQRLR